MSRDGRTIRTENACCALLITTRIWDDSNKTVFSSLDLYMGIRKYINVKNIQMKRK